MTTRAIVSRDPGLSARSGAAGPEQAAMTRPEKATKADFAGRRPVNDFNLLELARDIEPKLNYANSIRRLSPMSN